MVIAIGRIPGNQRAFEAPNVLVVGMVFGKNVKKATDFRSDRLIFITFHPVLASRMEYFFAFATFFKAPKSEP